MGHVVVSFVLPSNGERWNWPVEGDAVDALSEILDRADIRWSLATPSPAKEPTALPLPPSRVRVLEDIPLEGGTILRAGTICDIFYDKEGWLLGIRWDDDGSHSMAISRAKVEPA